MTLKKDLNFPIVIDKDREDDGYIAYCPILKGCHTYGNTIEEAEENIKEALELYLEVLYDKKDRIVKDNCVYESVNVAF